MIRRLHIQLTALCTVITGSILAVLTVICLLISESGIRAQESSSFSTNLNTMYQNLEVQSTLSHMWIRQMEYHYQFSVRIFDGGSPLFFQELEQDAQTESLLKAVIETASSEHGLDLMSAASQNHLRQQAEFTVRDEHGELYDASAALLPKSGGVLGVAVLHPLAPVNARILQQRYLFVLADLAALGVLGVFFWFFTGRMIRPLQENRKKQIQFIASASHELRSPLTVILSNVDAVKNGVMANDRSFLQTIESESRRMSRLVGDMLQLAGADNNTWSIHPSETELDTLLLQTWETFESLSFARKLKWEIELPDEPVPAVVCDAERIRQLLSILIDNAFAYTPKGGRVRLSLRTAASDNGDIPLNRSAPSWLPARSRPCVCISVSDNGPGIPDDQKKAVFERFHRLDRSRRDKSHFGLGLCIAEEIARLHHGRLILTDTPGGGATFTVFLPCGSRENSFSNAGNDVKIS